jgi:tetratricopeptide (TPR) repeat protein
MMPRKIFQRALSINQEDVRALRYSGYIEYFRHNYASSVQALENASAKNENPLIYYDLGVAQAADGKRDQALHSFARALSIGGNDILSLLRLEEHLCESGFAVGHPLRVQHASQRYKRYEEQSRLSFADSALFHLRRAVYLYPMYREAREKLRDYYRTMDYDRFMIDEMKRFAAVIS